MLDRQTRFDFRLPKRVDEIPGKDHKIDLLA
jgi:hypothetical protein